MTFSKYMEEARPIFVSLELLNVSELNMLGIILPRQTTNVLMFFNVLPMLQ